MRIFVLIGLLAGAALSSGGCATVAYSPAERSAMINRTWNIEMRQAVEDFDHIMLFYPPSQMSVWHVK